MAQVATISAYAVDTVDVCSGSKRVVVAVSLGQVGQIGQVLKSDSLLYFDIELKFDQNKIKFDQVLTSGTLSEKFTGFPTQGYFAGKGVVRATGGNIQDIPVTGSEPLIAFLGTVLSTCADTVNVEISYFDIEFKRPITDTVNAKVLVQEGKSLKRFASVKASQDSLNFNDSILTQQVIFSINASTGTKLREGILKVDYNTSSFKISQIAAETQDIEIVKVDSTITGVEISFKNLDTNSAVDRKIKAVFKRERDTNEVSSINVVLKDINDCSCVSFLKDSVSISVTNQKKIINTIDRINNIKEWKVEDLKDSWKIEIDDRYEIMVYSILGQLRGKYRSTGNSIIIDKNSLEAGKYIAVIRNVFTNTREIITLNK
ncbi:MAG: hypothetical protein V4642_03360 [Bacteroidota bacterium]